jgi:hypothetical protein
MIGGGLEDNNSKLARATREVSGKFVTFQSKSLAAQTSSELAQI